MLENHFSPEQLQQLADRRAELGSDRIEAAKVQWAALVEEGLRYVGDGTPVFDPAVREWAGSWDETGSLFHSGEQTKTRGQIHVGGEQPRAQRRSAAGPRTSWPGCWPICRR